MRRAWSRRGSRRVSKRASWTQQPGHLGETSRYRWRCPSQAHRSRADQHRTPRRTVSMGKVNGHTVLLGRGNKGEGNGQGRQTVARRISGHRLACYPGSASKSLRPLYSYQISHREEGEMLAENRTNYAGTRGGQEEDAWACAEVSAANHPPSSILHAPPLQSPRFDSPHPPRHRTSRRPSRPSPNVTRGWPSDADDSQDPGRSRSERTGSQPGHGDGVTLRGDHTCGNVAE